MRFVQEACCTLLLFRLARTPAPLQIPTECGYPVVYTTGLAQISTLLLDLRSAISTGLSYLRRLVDLVFHLLLRFQGDQYIVPPCYPPAYQPTQLWAQSTTAIPLLRCEDNGSDGFTSAPGTS